MEKASRVTQFLPAYLFYLVGALIGVNRLLGITTEAASVAVNTPTNGLQESFNYINSKLSHRLLASS